MRLASILTVIFVSFLMFFSVRPMTAVEETVTVEEPELTPADLGIDENGTAPMILTDQNGEPLSDRYQVVSDGMNEKFRVAEDATNVSITEHSVAYNTAALEEAGVPVAGEPDVQWTLTNQDSGLTQDAGSGSTEYSGVVKTPGHYNLGNSGMTPTDTVIANGSYGVNSGTDVEMEVTDITAPNLKVLVVPEDHHENNILRIEEDPDNLDAYPINEKTAKVTVSGRNWSQESAADASASPVDHSFSTYFGMVAPEDADKVADSRVNPDIKAKNEYTINSELDSGLGDGFYVPVSVRTNFAIDVEDDNDPRDPFRNAMAKTWKLVVEDGASREEFQEPPNFIFRKPNVPATSDTPRYTLVAEAIDGSGNAIVCNIPINVLPKNIHVTDLEQKSKKR